MNSFSFTDSTHQRYSISFNWLEKNKCTICLYPRKNPDSLAACSFKFTKYLILTEYKDWADEYLNQEVIDHVNKLIKNKVYW